MYKLISVVLAVAICLFVPMVHEGEVDPAQDRVLTGFSLVRSTDLPSRCYEVFLLEEGYYLSRYDGAAQPLGTQTVRALEGIIGEYDVCSWDGFSGNDSRVLDGEMFRLDLAFSDGTSVHASGSNRFPSGYSDAAYAMEKLLLDVPYECSLSPAGIYRYEGGGFGGDFTITLFPDGSYTFYEGALSSYIGAGSWSQSGIYLYLSEQQGRSMYNTLIPLKDALVFVGEDSDNFPYVKVPDGGRFIRAGSAEEAGGSRPSRLLTVGVDVQPEEITEFYYIYATSTYPPYELQYHFYIREDAWVFECETREGDQFPLPEEDTVFSAKKELSEDERQAFLRCLDGGTVTERRDPADTGDGDPGPWLYLYWDGDQGIFQEFCFASLAAVSAFEDFCEGLAE